MLRTGFVAFVTTALALSVPAGGQQAPPSAVAPKLAVIIVVDQMRADYIDRFSRDWTHGLKRLVDEGAWFRRAAYPYLTTVTCVGHSTIGTGFFPHRHGVIQNTWWDRDRDELVSCTQDSSARNVGYGVADKGSDSAIRLEKATLGDRLRTERGARIVSLSLKADSAIMLAGHGGVVTWASERADGWVTSSAYSMSPVPEVQAFIEANPIDADFGKTWTRGLAPERYEGPDDGLGETPPAGWTATFPHELKGKAGEPDQVYRQLWQRSPFADAYLGRFAASLVESLKLGGRGMTDLLAISFSTPDLVGHAFGPNSQEVQDVYLRLDETIGILLERLDTILGKGQYVVALSADHGVTPIAEQLARAGKDGGRIDGAAVFAAVHREATAALGDGNYVARVRSNDIYFQPGVYAKLLARRGALKKIAETVARVPGVAKAFSADEVTTGTTSSDPLLRAAALSYFAGRSGDMILVPHTGWEFSVMGAMHGTAAADDQRVPILLMGFGIKPGQYTQAATPADIAPTLAAICGLGPLAADGRMLTEALVAPPSSAAARRP